MRVVSGVEDAFFGRALPRERLQAWLDDSSARVMTIVGPAGVGKTRLVTELLRGWQRRGNSLLVCSLDGAQHQADVCRGVLQAAQLRLLPGQSDQFDGIARRLESWQGSLILLDAAEWMLSSASQLIAETLAVNPSLRFLVTSRVALDLKAVELLHLGPLETSSRLYLDRARRARPGSALRPSELPAVEVLVEELDGNPLALELAAARADAFGASEVSRELLGSSSSPSSSTLEALIEWSWTHLPEASAALLARASVLGSSFDRESLVIVTSATSEEIDQALALGQRYGFVNPTASNPAASEWKGERFAMPAPIREHARRQLSEAAERQAYCALADSLGEGALASEVAQARAEGVYHWASRAREPALAARAALVLCASLRERGMQGELLRLVDEALAQPGIAEAELLSLSLLRLRARLRTEPGRLRLADIEELAGRIEASGAGLQAAQAWLCFGALARFQGQPSMARPSERRALELAECGNERFQLQSLLELLRGATRSTLLEASELASLGALAERALELAGPMASREAGAQVRLIRAALALEGRELRRARSLVRGLLDSSSEDTSYQQPREHEARLLWARVLRASGSREEARAQLQTLLERARREGRRDLLRRCAQELAELEHEQGDLERAAGLLQEVQPDLGELLDREMAAAWAQRMRFWAARAALMADLGRLPRARIDLAEAEGLCHGPEARGLLAIARAHLCLAEATSEGASETASRRSAQLLDELEESSASLQVGLASSCLRARLERSSHRQGYVYDEEQRVMSLPGGRNVDLARRGPARRIFEGLLAQHPIGAPLDVQQTFACGWPGQNIAPEAASNRVYNAISTLRSFGLSDALEANREGYRLRPSDPWFVMAADRQPERDAAKP